MRTWICLLVVLVASCGEKKQDAGKAPETTKVGSNAGTTTAPAAIEIFIDDESVAKVPIADVASWPRVVSLLPESARRLGQWEKLSFVTGDGPASVDKPSMAYPDKVAVLFPNNGKPAFGLFDPVELANKGKAEFVAPDVSQIRLVLSKTERGGAHQGSTGEVVDPAKLVLVIETPDGAKQLTGPDILKLPREAEPNREDTKGWRVTQFLEAVGVKTYKTVTLVDANGTTLPFEQKDLDPKASSPFIKLNKSGQLRFRMYTKQGEGWAAGADLRALVSITVK